MATFGAAAMVARPRQALTLLLRITLLFILLFLATRVKPADSKSVGNFESVKPSKLLTLLSFDDEADVGIDSSSPHAPSGSMDVRNTFRGVVRSA